MSLLSLSPAVENGIQQPSPNSDQNSKKQITGVEAKLQCTNPDVAIENASAEHSRHHGVHGLQECRGWGWDQEGTGHRGDSESWICGHWGRARAKLENEGPKRTQDPPNGSASSPDKAQDETKKEESKEEGNSKEKQPVQVLHSHVSATAHTEVLDSDGKLTPWP